MSSLPSARSHPGAVEEKEFCSCRTTPEGRLEPADEPTSAQQLVHRDATRMAHPPARSGLRVSIAALGGGVCFAGAPEQPRCLDRGGDKWHFETARGNEHETQIADLRHLEFL
ncbi:MAG: hypothetical protein ACLPR9_07355 [Acidimicrobiales bacterium]